MEDLKWFKTCQTGDVKHIFFILQLVEGSDRIGGRVKDVKFGGVNVEVIIIIIIIIIIIFIFFPIIKYDQVGANWVHFSKMGGNDRNSVEEMCKAAHLNIIQDPYDDYIFRLDLEN